MESEFYKKMMQKKHELQDIELNDLISQMVDFMHMKGLIDMDEFIEFIESRALADKMAHQEERSYGPSAGIAGNIFTQKKIIPKKMVVRP